MRIFISRIQLDFTSNNLVSITNSQLRKMLTDISKKHNIWGMKVSIELSMLKLKTINADIDFAADFLKQFSKC
jgi:hypothetical protein